MQLFHHGPKHKLEIDKEHGNYMLHYKYCKILQKHKIELNEHYKEMQQGRYDILIILESLKNLII